MEDKEQKIKINVETNADDAAKKIDGLTESTNQTAAAQTNAGGSSKALGKSLSELDTPINGTISGMKGMVKSMWAIVANPLGAILAAIVLVVIGLVAVFKSFQPLVDKVEQSMAALGAIFNVVKNAFLSVFTGTKSLSEAFGSLGSDMNEAADRTMKLVKAQQDLEDVLKSQEVTTAKNRAAINKLNVELRNRTKTDEERLDLANKIVDKEKQDYEQRKKLVDQEVRLAREAIAIKAQFTKEEIKQLKQTGDATKELAESRGGNYDEEYDALNKARLKAIALEDEVTVNVEKAYNRRDKIQDDQQAKNEKAAAETKARNDKAAAEERKRQDKKNELIKQGTDAENSLLKSNQDLKDKTDEEKLTRQKERAEQEIQILKDKGINVENITRLNDEKFRILEKELADKRKAEQKIVDDKLVEDTKANFDKKLEKKLIEADNEKLAFEARLAILAERDALILGNQKLTEEERTKLLQENVDKRAQIEKASKDFQEAELRQGYNNIQNILSIGGKKMQKISKALAIADVVRTSAKSVAESVAAIGTANSAALATPQAIATSGASAIPTIALNTLKGGLQIGSTIASAAKAIQSINGDGKSAPSNSLSGGGGGGGGGGSSAVSATPQVSFQASSENQIGNTLARNTNEAQPIEAFIVESSVSTATALAEKRITSNSI